MFCTKCGSPIHAGARFCGTCGAPASTALAPAAPVQPVAPRPLATPQTPPAPVQARQQPGAPDVPAVPACCLIYLFGDRFAPRDNILTRGLKVPCSEINVQRKPLTELMMVAALATLVQSGHITLAIGQRGVLLLKRNALHINLARSAAQDPGGLEGPLLRALTGRQGSDFVEDVVGRVIGPANVDPWGDVVNLAERAMLTLGLYAEEKHTVMKLITVKRLTPDCARIAAVQPQAASAGSLLQAWQTGNPGLYQQLYADVKRGIQSRYEAPDTGSDSISTD